MNLKRIVLATICLFTLVLQADSQKCAGQDCIRIVAVANNSAAKALLSTSVQEIEIKPQVSKKMIVKVPYSELKKNLLDIAQDRPYFPSDALKLVTQEGTFYIWSDERGVIGAKPFERGVVSREEAKAKVLVSISPEERVKVIGCLVTIDMAGILSVKRA
jgi:peroxiredoxin family protein